MLYTLYCYCCGTNVYCLPMEYGNLHSITLPSFLHVSLSISELHQRTYYQPSLLWCQKGIVYQHVIWILASHHKPYQFTKFYASKHSGKRHKHVFRMLMYGPNLFFQPHEADVFCVY